MRILYLDIDSLRPDHLGCYGYSRPTSPNLDRIAARGLRFNRCYASDVPCMPSRTALFSGRSGTRTGVLNHGGRAADPRPSGPKRGVKNAFGQSSWMQVLRDTGYRTATITSFADRHSAFHFYAGFNDMINPGKAGMDLAHEVTPLALDWLDAHGSDDDWFLHVNLWDPHIPYRTPASFGEPFADTPLPPWPDEATRQHDWGTRVGSFSPQEVCGFGLSDWEAGLAKDHPRQPMQIANEADLRRMFDGYDTGIRYADHHVGIILDKLERLGITNDTAVLVSSDHGENLGELGIYGDHQTADAITARLPMIVSWPGVTDERAGEPCNTLCYAFDLAATTLELCGATVPENWDGQALPEGWAKQDKIGRDELVISTAASTCQRAVVWGNHIAIHTRHDGYHLFPEWMAFDLQDDPHQQHDLTETQPALIPEASRRLSAWIDRVLGDDQDPITFALEDGGPFYCWGLLEDYRDRLLQTGRSGAADRLGEPERYESTLDQSENDESNISEP